MPVGAGHCSVGLVCEENMVAARSLVSYLGLTYGVVFYLDGILELVVLLATYTFDWNFLSVRPLPCTRLVFHQ